MKPHILLLLLQLLSPSIAAGKAPPGRSGQVEQRVVHSPGFVEPHTPGSGAPEEVATAPGIEALLGAAPDLNRVSTVRTTWQGPGRRRPFAPTQFGKLNGFEG